VARNPTEFELIVAGIVFLGVGIYSQQVLYIGIVIALGVAFLIIGAALFVKKLLKSNKKR